MGIGINANGQVTGASYSSGGSGTTTWENVVTAFRAAAKAPDGTIGRGELEYLGRSTTALDAAIAEFSKGRQAGAGVHFRSAYDTLLDIYRRHICVPDTTATAPRHATLTKQPAAAPLKYKSPRLSAVTAGLPNTEGPRTTKDFLSAARWVIERDWGEQNKRLKSLIVGQLLGEPTDEIGRIATADHVDRLLAQRDLKESKVVIEKARAIRANKALDLLVGCHKAGLITDDNLQISGKHWDFLNNADDLKSATTAKTILSYLERTKALDQLNTIIGCTTEKGVQRKLLADFSRKLESGKPMATAINELRISACGSFSSKPTFGSRRGFIMSDLPPTLLKFSHGVFGFTTLQIFANQISRPEILKPLDYLAPFFLAQGVVMSTLPTATGIIGGGIGNEIGSDIAHRLNLSRKQTRNVEIVSSTIGGLIGTAAPFALLGEKAVSAASIVNLVARCVAPQVEAVIFIGGICVAGYLLYQDASQHIH